MSDLTPEALRAIADGFVRALDEWVRSSREPLMGWAAYFRCAAEMN